VKVAVEVRADGNAVRGEFSCSIEVHIETGSGYSGAPQGPIVGSLEKALSESRKAVVDALKAAPQKP
jgi:hypothetical protein